MINKTFVIVLIVLFSFSFQTVLATTYYVSSSEGKDIRSGKKPNKPWKTLRKVNNFNLKPGDSVLFKRGDKWRGLFSPKVNGNSNSYIYYGAYGKGKNPVFLGSVSANKDKKWKNAGSSLWRLKLKGIKDIGNIYLDDNAYLADKKPYLSDLDTLFNFVLIPKYLYIKSEKNPATIFESIEIATDKLDFLIINNSYLIFENLKIMYSGIHGIQLVNVSNIQIKNCSISYIGGCYMTETHRYGNGIEFWNSVENCLVKNCHIDQIYDTGLTNQSSRKENVIQANVTYDANVISNCGLASFEYFNRPESSISSNIIFKNNSSRNAGYGWGEKKDNYGGYHLLFQRNNAKTSQIIIENNHFFNSRKAAIVIFSTGARNVFNYLKINNNSYEKQNDSHYLFRLFSDDVGWKKQFKYKDEKSYIEYKRR